MTATKNMVGGMRSIADANNRARVPEESEQQQLHLHWICRHRRRTHNLVRSEGWHKARRAKQDPRAARHLNATHGQSAWPQIGLHAGEQTMNEERGAIPSRQRFDTVSELTRLCSGNPRHK